MTVGQTLIADICYLAGLVLFLSKFYSWDLSRNIKKNKFYAAISIISCVVAIGAIEGNHFLNRPKHTSVYLQYLAPKIINRPEFNGVGPGRQLGFNVTWMNFNPERVFNASTKTEIIVIEKPNADTPKRILELCNKERIKFDEEYQSGINVTSELARGDGIWGSVGTDPLSESQSKGLFDGSTRIYVISFCSWQDAGKNTDSSFRCNFLQWLPIKSSNSYTDKDLVWHNCFSNK